MARHKWQKIGGPGTYQSECIKCGLIRDKRAFQPLYIDTFGQKNNSAGECIIKKSTTPNTDTTPKE